MKKFAVIMIALAVATFTIVSVSAQSADWWYVTGREGGSRAKDNQVKLSRGKNYIYLYFRDGKPGADFDKIQLDFTLDKPLEVVWQAFYGPNALVVGSEEVIGTIDKGPIETDFTGFNKVWSGRGALNKKTMVGMCLMVTVPSGNATFTMNSVQFLGLQQ